VARSWARRKFGQLLAPVERVICSSPMKMIVLLRLSPVFPFSPVGYALGSMNINVATFASATALGVLPGCLLYSWMGASLKDASQSGGDDAGSIISICVCVVSTLAVSYFAKLEYNKACASDDSSRKKA
jgi:uncharacterized membrane protein YdjX (TVP38/TMEM64 family)